MKRYIGKWICIGLGMILLCAVGCGDGQVQSGVVSEATPEPEGGEDTIVLAPEATGAQEQQTPALETTEAPSEQTAEPTTPQPTRPPIAGDICTDRFPNYDTGTDADWSYQSDEMRIAIKRIRNEEDDTIYNVADVWIRNINNLRMGFGHGKFDSGREEPEDFATREHAIFAVNGTMNSGLVIHNGQVVKKSVENSDHIFRSGIIIIYRDGSVKLINRSQKETYKYDKEKNQNGGIWQALQFGPVLVQNGVIPDKEDAFSRRSRTVFGYCEPGHYILVTADDMRDTVGMTMQELAELMVSLGCTDAINLDGGQSTSMVFMGKRINAKPASDRIVSDMMLFAEYDADGNAPALTDVSPDNVRGE